MCDISINNSHYLWSKLWSSVHTLSSESRARYVAKVVESGTKNDPYTTPEDMWLKEFDVVSCVQWSDMFIYFVSTPSTYTREEIKVNLITTIFALKK